MIDICLGKCCVGCTSPNAMNLLDILCANTAKKHFENISTRRHPTHEVSVPIRPDRVVKALEQKTCISIYTLPICRTIGRPELSYVLRRNLMRSITFDKPLSHEEELNILLIESTHIVLTGGQVSLLHLTRSCIWHCCFWPRVSIPWLCIL